jgi:thiosulfate/3-mercaptopyruvate sulfurtransferase
MKFSLQSVGHRNWGAKALIGTLAAGACLLSSACSDDDGFGIINPDAGYRPPVPTTDQTASGDAGPGESSPDAAATHVDAAATEPLGSDTASEARPGIEAGTSTDGRSSGQTGPVVVTDETTGDEPSTDGETTSPNVPSSTDVGRTSDVDPSTEVEATSSAPSTIGPVTSEPVTSQPGSIDSADTSAPGSETQPDGGDIDTGAPIDTFSSVAATSAAPASSSAAASTDLSGVIFTLDPDATDAGLDAGTSGADDTSVDASVSSDPETDAGATTDASVDAGESIHVATLQELTDQSASDYADNEHGLIDGTRLQQWLTNWQVQRPPAIDGRLVILQVVPSGVTTEVHVAANEAAGIYSYLVPASEFNSPRSSGLSAFESDIPNGEAADAWLAKYAIDPRSDFILLTFEDQPGTTNSIVQSVGRAWVFLKYWGVATDHVGILNGSVDWNGTNAGVALGLAVDEDYSVPPLDGTVTVRDLGVDATALSISLEEIIAILHEEPGAPDVENVRIVDARGGAEALGLKKATSTGRTDCASYTGSSPNAKCSTPFEGRIKGAHSVPWAQFLDSKANGFRFLSRDQVKTIFDDQAEWDVDAEWSIQYCRTNQRSTVTGIVANVILGYPTRLYETSFIEWGHSSTTPGIVAADFPFRTDLPTLTEHAELHPDDLGAYTPGGTLGALTQPVTWVAGPNYNDVGDVSPPTVQPWPANASGWPKLDANATTTRLAIDTDRAYLRGISIEDLD